VPFERLSNGIWSTLKSGDLSVLVEVEPSDCFERRGENLYTQVRIPLTTALLGVCPW